MKNTSRAFSYTALRGSYISIVSALLFIVMVEGGVIALLIAGLIPNELIKLVLLCLLAALYLFVSNKLLAPLWTKHRLNTRSLELHFGYAAGYSLLVRRSYPGNYRVRSVCHK
jgi:uncharacterized membrane protein YfcA